MVVTSKHSLAWTKKTFFNDDIIEDDVLTVEQQIERTCADTQRNRRKTWATLCYPFRSHEQKNGQIQKKFLQILMNGRWLNTAVCFKAKPKDTNIITATQVDLVFIRNVWDSDLERVYHLYLPLRNFRVYMQPP